MFMRGKSCKQVAGEPHVIFYKFLASQSGFGAAEIGDSKECLAQNVG